MKTINIKGKEYIEVNERIKHFRENYKGSIITEIISNESGVCIMKAMILDEERNVVSTGHAYEKEGSSLINKTSYIENCETSAIGRALGILGIGIDTSIGSAEEVGNAIKQQDATKQKKQQDAAKQEKQQAHVNVEEVKADIDICMFPEDFKKLREKYGDILDEQPIAEYAMNKYNSIKK